MRVSVCVASKGKYDTQLAISLSPFLSVIMGKRMETKRKLLAISHQHIFFNYSSVLSALLGHVFSSCCCCCCCPCSSPSPALNSCCCCCCCSFVFICTGSELLCMAAFCAKKKGVEGDDRSRWPSSSVSGRGRVSLSQSLYLTLLLLNLHES